MTTFLREEEQRLERRLLAAHAAADKVSLVTLYREAGDLAEAAGDLERACFFMTQAWIFALDAGDERAGQLRARLARHGRMPVEGKVRQ